MMEDGENAIRGSRSFDRSRRLRAWLDSQKPVYAPCGRRNGLARDGAAAAGVVVITIAVILLALHLLDILVLSDTGAEPFNPVSKLGFQKALAPVIVGGLLAGLGSLLGSGAQSISTVAAQKAANAANMELARYQYSKDLDMWNRQNWYNSPQEQMARLSRAGLNPNLVYGNGVAGASGSAAPAQMAKFQAPEMRPVPAVIPDVATALSAYQDFRMKSAQTDNLKAQNDAIKQNVALSVLREKVIGNQALGQEYKNAALGLDADVKRATQDSRIMQVQESARLKRAQRIALEQSTAQKGALSNYQLQVMSEKARRSTLEYAKMEQEMKRMDAQTQLTQKQIDWFTTKLWGDLLIKGLGAGAKLVPLKSAFEAGTKMMEMMK